MAKKKKTVKKKTTKKTKTEKAPLIYEGENDYILKDQSVWITVKDFSVYITKTDEGVVCDLYVKGREDDGSIAGTYAYDDEIDEYLDGEDEE
jgi:hypothetical protein